MLDPGKTMKTILKTLFSFWFSTSFALVYGQSLDLNKGFRLPLDIITQDYTLLEKRPEAEYLRRYIQKANYKVPSSDAAAIAEGLVLVSQCLEIDPWIMTGLVQKESSFIKEAVSPTGAAGLTQFTAIGLKEVNDQLGLRGKTGAPEAVTFYFLTQVRGCVDSEWIELWRKIEVPENDPQFYPLLKNQLKQDITSSVLYGAILLKVYLSFITNKNQLETRLLPLIDTYFQALQMYNGEEGEARVKYAKNVFKHTKSVYPDPIDLPTKFIEE